MKFDMNDLKFYVFGYGFISIFAFILLLWTIVLPLIGVFCILGIV